MEITFLSADVPLTKHYTTTGKTPYPHVSFFSSHTETFGELYDFKQLLQTHAKQGHCLLKGQLNRPLQHESRAGSTASDDETRWVCLDIDGLKGYETPQQVMDLLGLGDVSYIIQWSASAGIEEHRGMSCHIFFLLDTPVRAPILKAWLMHLNLHAKLEEQGTKTEIRSGVRHDTVTTTYTYPLREQITLTRTGAALRWPLDITVCQNDKLIYIAPPTMDIDVVCSIKSKDRITLVQRTLDALPSSRLQFNVLSAAYEEARTLRDELRAAAKLPKLSTKSLKWERGQEVQHNPGRAMVTSSKSERGFTYLNLNGGDSWGYYHPEDDAKFIYNFKGEPTYLAEELVPDYWAAWREARHAAQAPEATGIDHFIFCDPRSGAYYKGHYNLDTRGLTLWQARSEKQVQDYLRQQNLPELDPIPDWTLTFDPQNTTVFDRSNRFINQFQITPLLETALDQARSPKSKAPGAEHWPVIDKIISSAVGTGEIKEHFLNWLACLIQYREKLLTAWILHGTQGTGKGMLIDRIITPILGAQHVVRCTQSALEKNFNGFLETALLVFIDEASIAAYKNSKAASENLKSMITEPFQLVEKKYANAYNTQVYYNVIMGSNQPDPATVDPEDRRFNVGQYQQQRLQITSDEVMEIDTELPAFTQYLTKRIANMDVARTVLETGDRTRMKAITRSAADSVADALRAGNLEFFIDALPAAGSLDPFSAHAIAAQAYSTWLTGIIQAVNEGTTETRITREELRIVFNYLVGDIPQTPNKFTSYLKHRRIELERMRFGEERHVACAVAWKHHPELLIDAARQLKLKPKLSVVVPNAAVDSHTVSN
jgi:hypothetical protein